MIFFLLSAPSRYHYSLTTTLSHVAIYYIVVYADRDAVVGDAVVCFNDGDTGDEAEADDDDDDVGEVFRAIDNTITLQWEGQ